MADFFENIWGWFVVRPERILNAGWSFFSGGAILFVAGLWGRVASAAVNVLSQMAKKPFDASLAAMYPDFPTWWIPESVVGLVFAALLVAVGIYLTLLGKKLNRLLHY